jgi:hypothetical protein
MTIAAIAIGVVIAGHVASAQVSLPPSLKTVAVPEPNNLRDFIKDKTAAISRWENHCSGICKSEATACNRVPLATSMLEPTADLRTKLALEFCA